MKIDASNGWHDTGLEPAIVQGQFITVKVVQGAFQYRDIALDANGLKPEAGIHDHSSISTENNAHYPYNGKAARSGQLIGKLGEDGAPFMVGDYCQIPTKGKSRNSRLYLRINLSDQERRKPQGELHVDVSVSNERDFQACGERWDLRLNRWVPL